MTKHRLFRATWLAALLCLIPATRALCVDFQQIFAAPPTVQACMEKQLDPETMALIRAGKRPEQRADRKTVWKTYEACVAAQDGSQGLVPYDGPLFDAMSQIDETVGMDKAMNSVRAAGVSKLALFARSRKTLHENEQAVLNLARRNPDLIVLGAPKYFQLSGDVSTNYIRSTVQGIEKYGYRFIGELLYTHGDKQSGKQYPAGERYVDPSKPGTATLLKAIAPFKIPFMTHWEPYASERDFPRFHALYSAWPNQIFLLPHMGFASAAQMDEFLGRHPNLYALMSKKERRMNDFSDPGKFALTGSAMLDGNTLHPEWKALLVKFQDRILFATDPHMKKLWRRYGETVDRQRLILGQLPRDVAEKIAYRNAEKVYGVSLK